MNQLDLKDKIHRIEELKKAYQYKKTCVLKENEVAFGDYLTGRMGLLATQLDFNVDRVHFEETAAFRQYVNHARMGSVEAYGYMVERLNKGNKELSVDFVKELHGCLLGLIQPEVAGKWRNMPARWLNSTMIVSNYRKIEPLIEETVLGYNEKLVPAFFWDECPNSEYQSFASHPVMQAIQINYNIVSIHPFSDGNKRLARLLSNFVLMGSGYAPMTIHNREGYISGIENYFTTRKPHQFYKTMFHELESSHYDMLHEIEQFPQKGAADPKVIASHANRFRDRLDKELFPGKIHGKTR